jgi:serine kinase of HPr protein (carbohydrate metabolism regulator)
VLLGRHAALIRGPSGAGKSRLALALLQAADRGELRFARLVADDRVHLQVTHGRLLARPAEALAGMIEVRGLGIRRFPFEPRAEIGLLVDLGVAAVGRMPSLEESWGEIEGVRLPRLPIGDSGDPLGMLLAYLRTQADPRPNPQVG